jgi:hypothetical protein
MPPSTPCPHCGGSGVRQEKALDAARRRGLVIRYRDLPEHLRGAPQARRCAALSYAARPSSHTRDRLRQCRLAPLAGSEFCAEHRALLIRQALQRAAEKTATAS